MTYQQFNRLGFVLSFSLFCSMSQASDIVNRKSGEKRAAGTITGVTKTEITVKPPTGNDRLTVPANDVLSVDWDDAPAVMKLARADENNGRFEAALEKFQKATEDLRSGNDLVKTDLEFLMARVRARMALTDADQSEAAITKLKTFLSTHEDNFRYYDTLDWLGQVQLATQDFAAARETFESLGKASLADYQLAAKIHLGRVMLSENKPDQAVQYFDDAITTAGTSVSDQARKYEALVGKSRGLIVQNHAGDALASLNEILEKAPANDTALQAEAYVLQGYCLQSLNKNKEAVLAYLHVDVLYPKESVLHAEALYQLSRLWKTVQHPDRALEAQSKLESMYPHSTWAKKISTGGE